MTEQADPFGTMLRNHETLERELNRIMLSSTTAGKFASMQVACTQLDPNMADFDNLQYVAYIYVLLSFRDKRDCFYATITMHMPSKQL